MIPRPTKPICMADLRVGCAGLPATCHRKRSGAISIARVGARLLRLCAPRNGVCRPDKPCRSFAAFAANLQPASPRHQPSQIAGEVRTRRERKMISIEMIACPTPALGCLVVLGTGLDPALAAGRFLALPERRVGLQPIDQEMASGERRLAMRRGGCD